MPGATIACVICNQPARAAPVFADFLHFDCTACGQFRASASFIEQAKDLPMDARRQALQNAVVRAQYGAMSVVTTYDVP
ncbi:MAG: hypothetical protein ACTHJV_02695 [Rhizobiaceae bacterium]